MASPVRLRKVRISDVREYERWWQEPEGNYYDIGDRDAQLPPGYADRIRRAILTGGTQTWFTVERPGTGPVGYVLYRNLDRRDQSAEIGIRLGQDYWGKGYGTAATFLLLHHLFIQVGLRVVWLQVAEFNKRAFKMYTRLGFRETARQKEDELVWIRMEIGREAFRNTLQELREEYLPEPKQAR